MDRAAVGQVMTAETVAGDSETVGQKGRTSREVTEDVVSETDVAQAPLEVLTVATVVDREMVLGVVEDPVGLEVDSKEEPRP